jgi:hypothetical protein
MQTNTMYIIIKIPNRIPISIYHQNIAPTKNKSKYLDAQINTMS